MMGLMLEGFFKRAEPRRFKRAEKFDLFVIFGRVEILESVDDEIIAFHHDLGQRFFVFVFLRCL